MNASLPSAGPAAQGVEFGCCRLTPASLGARVLYVPVMKPSDPGFSASIADRVLAGELDALNHEGLVALLSGEGDLWDLMAAADRVRRTRFGKSVHLCSIVNSKEGGCPEDCGFCSQSKHFQTHVDAKPFLPDVEAVQASEVAARRGASALGLVAAVRGIPDESKAMDIAEAQIRAVRDAGHAEAHASLGLVSRSGFDRLAAAGLTEYNHNLESGPEFFRKIVKTHTYEERIETIRNAKAAGLRTCVGGIMGMGESPKDRADLALQLRELDVDEVPINYLVSIDGTVLESADPMSPREMLRVIACFRLALPRPNIFIAAGRHHLGHLMPMMFSAGASGMMIGDFLTTPNHDVNDDLRMLEELGLEPLTCGAGAARPEIQSKPPVVASRTSEGLRLPVLPA